VNIKIIRTMAKFGTPSPVIEGVMVVISILISANWSINDPLSDLGSSGLESVIFNSGLLMAGSLAMLFAAGLFEFTKGSIIGQIGSAAFLGYAISTCAVGVVIIDMGALHDQFATALFLLIPVSAALISYNLLRKGLKNHAILGVIATILGIVPWLIGGPVGALKEIAAFLPFSIWQIALGLHMYGLEEPNEWD
jgi:hypothetical membrane protein